MAAPIPARFTTNSTMGNRGIIGLGIAPTYLKFYLSGRTSATDTGTRMSIGSSNGSVHTCLSFESATGTPPVYIDRVINLLTPTGSIIATLVSLDADGFTLNFSSTVSGYRVLVEAYA